MIQRLLFGFLAAITTSPLLFAEPAEAGPPLVCREFDIGNANSLPWDTSRNSGDQGYDLKRLVPDTLGLLNADVPVIARMETLRRAALYAKRDPRVATELLSTMVARADGPSEDTNTKALAEFDAGYLIESYKQANLTWKKLPNDKYEPVPQPNPASNLNGYGRVLIAINLRRRDPEMEFAAALITALPRLKTHEQHVIKAATGVTDGSLLAKNLVTHLGDEVRSSIKQDQKQLSAQ